MGTHAEEGRLNYLKIVQLSLPTELSLKKETIPPELRDSGGFNVAKAQVKVIQRIVHDTEVNRARYNPQNPRILSSWSASGNTYIFDMQRLPSTPGPTPVFDPDIALRGHDNEGYGLAWNYFLPSIIATTADDGKTCVYDITDPSAYRMKLSQVGTSNMRISFSQLPQTTTVSQSFSTSPLAANAGGRRGGLVSESTTASSPASSSSHAQPRRLQPQLISTSTHTRHKFRTDRPIVCVNPFISLQPNPDYAMEDCRWNPHNANILATSSDTREAYLFVHISPSLSPFMNRLLHLYLLY